MKKVYLFFALLLASMTMVAQNNDSTYTVEVFPRIEHGTLHLRPEGLVHAETWVTVTPVPDNGYHVVSITPYLKDAPTQTLTVDENNRFLMPYGNVVVTAEFEMGGPTINGNIIAPDPICAGESLVLVAPSVSNATSQGWILRSPTQEEVAYTGQVLDVSYNHWSLLFWAANSEGTAWSNTVTITVNAPVTLHLDGEAYPCNMKEVTYTVNKENHVTYTWTVSDTDAIVTSSSNTAKVRWATAGTQTITVVGENSSTGCSSSAEMVVQVQSYVETPNTIVAKVHDGKEYILIYPNPADTYKYQWYKDGQKIDGATGQYYYQSGGLDNGDYKVYVALNADAEGNLFCGAFTTVHTVNNAQPERSIWPNPAESGEGLVITNDSQDEAQLSIYSIDGKLLHHQRVGSGRTTLSLSLPQGIYFCHFSDGSSMPNIQKLVIQ